MLGFISNLILVICLVGSVAGSALVRVERQWDFGDINENTGRNGYGRCGEPNIPIPHGGIKFFPISDFYDPHDHSCETTSRTDCEPKFYCFDGYEVDGNIHLECVHDEETEEYKWEGEIPKCVKPTTTPLYIYPVISVGVVSLIVCMSAIARRRMRSSPARCVTTRTVVITPPSILSNGPPGYTRFDDSHVQVPKDGTTQNK